MAGLHYVGPSPIDPDDLVARQNLTDALNAANPSRTTAASQVLDTAATLASKTFVDNADNVFALASYATDQDALNIPTTSRGVANGVASLDATTKVPLVQIPAAGAGYVLGPYGPRHRDGSSAVFTGSTGSTPLRIADFDIGPVPASSRPLVFLSCFVSSINAHPVIEVRASDGINTYANQTLVASGHGRSYFNDPQAITVLPSPHTTGLAGTTTPTAYDNLWLTAWLYDTAGQVVTITQQNWLVSAGAFLWRTAE